MSEELIEKFNLTLSDVPVDLHRAWKAISALKGISMKEAALEAIKNWVNLQSNELELSISEKIGGTE